jgi:hypothetical protein
MTGRFYYTIYPPFTQHFFTARAKYIPQPCLRGNIRCSLQPQGGQSGLTIAADKQNTEKTAR